jgi:diguanylate cyclase (GGDEF)-like protein
MPIKSAGPRMRKMRRNRPSRISRRSGWRPRGGRRHEVDPLTGLPNHRGFRRRLEQELERARRRREPLALVVLDVDNFQAINESHGHRFGDEVLTSIATRLRELVRDNGTAARIGGDAFALILPYRGTQDSRRVAQRARDAVAGVSVPGLDLSCSAGFASYPRDAEEASGLLKLAEGALQWAKRPGRGRTRRFDHGQIAVAWTKRHAREIRDLLDGSAPVRAVFQPVVALASGELVGYEALARFARSSGRSPVAWFGQAHGCGLGAELEAAAIRAALKVQGRPAGTHLALNVSPSALASEAVAEALPADLSDIVIEITEHEFVADEDSLADLLADLRARGARIALDDAGAGYAGLTQVMRVRPDIVKLDRNLTRAIHASPARMALVESFVRFARRVDTVVCAEGIETLDDLATLADLDVPWGQGFVLAHPGEPWARVSPEAVEVCRGSLAKALQPNGNGNGRITAGDRRLEHLSASLAGARTRHDLRAALAMIADELDADNVCLSYWDAEAGVVDTLAESVASSEVRFPVAEYPLTAHVIESQSAVQVIAGAADADRHEVDLLLKLGYRSLLMMPVVNHGEALGIVEAYSRSERPWTRTQINRARIISNQFASVIQTFVQPRRAEAAEPRLRRAGAR